MISNKISNIFWVLLESVYLKSITSIMTIVLALFLNIEEYGLFSIVYFFIASGVVLAELGLKAAIIRKNSILKSEYDSIFTFLILYNLLVIILIILFSTIYSIFIDNLDVVLLVCISSFAIFFSLFQIIPLSILSINLNFRSQTIASVISITMTALITLSVLFLFDIGVWILVVQIVLLHLSLSLSLNYFTVKDYRPRLSMKFSDVRALLIFSYKLSIAGFFDAMYRFSTPLIITKYISFGASGSFFLADRLKDILFNVLFSVVQKISFSYSAGIKDNDVKLLMSHRSTHRYLSYICYPVFAILHITIDPLFTICFPEKWHFSGEIFSYFMLIAFLSPLIYVNTNVIKLIGCSREYMYLCVFIFFISITLLLLFIDFGINGIYISQFITTLLNSTILLYICHNSSDYKLSMQLLDMLPSLVLTFVTLVFVKIGFYFFAVNDLISILFSVIIFILIYVLFSHMTKNKVYFDLINYLRFK